MHKFYGISHFLADFSILQLFVFFQIELSGQNVYFVLNPEPRGTEVKKGW